MFPALRSLTSASQSACSHSTFFQEFFNTTSTSNPLTSHYLAIYHFCPLSLSSLATLDYIVSPLPTIHSPICITNRTVILFGMSSLHEEEDSSCLSLPCSSVWPCAPVLCSEYWAAVYWGLVLRNCFAFLIKGDNHNWHVPSPLLPFPLSFCLEQRHDIWSRGNHLTTTRWRA